MKLYVLAFYLIIFSHISYCVSDLAIVGPLKLADGIGRISLGIYESLKKDVSICFKPSEVAEQDLEIFEIPSNFNNDRYSRILIATDPASRFANARYSNILRKSSIRFAYSMFESTELPLDMVSAINKNFDAVLVGDEEIKKIYEANGIIKPVFVLPCPTFLQQFLSKPLKKCSNEIFTFGASGRMLQSKNFEKILVAFADEFGNSDDVRLVLHSRYDWTHPDVNLRLQKIIEERNLTNVEIIYKNLTNEEYENFIIGLDCFICISKGEGFSFPPREAMAAGIPVILSDNTAHKVICSSGFVLSVQAALRVPAYYELMGRQFGFQFDCELSDVKKVIRHMYENYSFYLSKAEQARFWVMRYLPESIRPYLLALVRPNNVSYGTENKIFENGFVTNDWNLYEKYKVQRKNLK